jgi:hypothetical protein
MLNTQNVKSTDLINGKMGIVLFFYHYARRIKNEIYNDVADDLLDEVIESLHTDMTTTFADGLSGIGYGINYLINNKFVSGDANDILEEIDNSLFRDMEQQLGRDLQASLPLFSAGLYFIERDCKSEIFETVFFELKSFLLQNRETLPLNYLNSVLYIIMESLSKSVKPEFYTEILPVLYENISDSVRNKHYTCPDAIVLTTMIERLYKVQNSGIKNKPWIKLLEIADQDNFNATFNWGMYNLIYPRTKDSSLISEQLKKVNWEKQIDYMVKNINPKNLGVYNGLAGIGLALIDYAFEK